jgi:Tfp pilus assembly protein PilO
MLSDIETARRPFMDALLTPLLESWAMRAKSKLDPLAADVGVKVTDYAELPVRALPLPKPVPKQLYARRPIRVMVQGSYAEIASFVLRVEKMLPYVSLQALNIKAQRTPEVQSAELVFEWPAKGALSVPVASGGVKK